MSGRIITCDSCGERKRHHRRDWCRGCWNRWDRAKRPDSGPPPRRTGRVGEYLELTREQGYTLADAATRMGISHRTAQRHEARLRKEGVPPLNTVRFGVLATRPAVFTAQYGQAVA